MCGCGGSSRVALAAQAYLPESRWRVQYPDGQVKAYLSEAEARIAQTTVPASVLLAPTTAGA